MKLIHLSMLAALGTGLIAVPATAQQTPDVIMITPGVYTTPEISKKCQAYAIKRVGLSQNTDNARTAVALQCAKKLWAEQQAKAKKKGS
jgi:hypothetical protein